DTISITRTNPGWPTTFSWGSQAIAAGDQRELKVTVTVPDDAPPGAADQADIQASGSGGQATLTLTTRTPVRRIYLPLVLRNFGP
ncbi:MAG: hypothetical protein ACUVR4_06955, partial [Anaerolineae bacterium]